MTLPCGLTGNNAEMVVDEMIATLRSMVDQLSAWRGRISASNSASGQEAYANYQRLTSARTYLTTQIALQPAAIAASYTRRFAELSEFDPDAEWTKSKAAMDAFISWFQDNWPKTPGGFPAFVQYNATTGELQDMSIPLAGATKTLVLSRIDAVIATFS